jgi:protein-disulfide isomerase
MLRTALCAALAVAAIACTKSDDTATSTTGSASDDDGTPKIKVEKHRPEGAATLGGGGSAEERIAKLEKRVNQLTKVLEDKLPPPEADPDRTYAVGIDPLDPIEGPADAKVTIVEGFEFLCPYCFKANPTVEQVRQAYPKDVRIVNKYFLIHGPPAIPPGLAACAANKQGKFSDMKKALWQHVFGDGEPDKDKVSIDSMNKLASDLKLDMTKFKADMMSTDCQGWIQHSADTLSVLGTTGTPSFYVNGRHLNGAVPFEDMKQIIDEEMKKADKAIAGGVPQAQYYQREIVGKGDKKVAGYFDD